MSESFVHYIWQYQYFESAELSTSSGESIRIFSPGTRNPDAGPDFLQARIRIGDLQWIGSVEIHINASAWYQHFHESDEAYDNVILHVVWSNDTTVCRRDGTPLPVLELKNRVDENLIVRFRSLSCSVEPIPCSTSLSTVKPVIVLNTLDRMLSYRLEQKARDVIAVVKRNRGDWEETAYQLVARNFGFRVNTEPFLQLAQALPLKTLMKHRDRLLQIEAMIFGVAGFLEDDEDHEYYKLLQREYNLLRQKYRLDHKAMNRVQWKFLRLRPANFPTLRMAQFAAFVFHQQPIFPMFLAADEADIIASFRNPPSPYWRDHYNFRKASVRKEGLPGDDSIHNLVINTVVPLLAAYAISRDEQMFMDKAVRMLHNTPAEANKITRRWSELSMVCVDAFDSQALIELYNNFCSRRRCLDCNIGASLIKPERH